MEIDMFLQTSKISGWQLLQCQIINFRNLSDVYLSIFVFLQSFTSSRNRVQTMVEIKLHALHQPSIMLGRHFNKIISMLQRPFSHLTWLSVLWLYSLLYQQYMAHPLARGSTHCRMMNTLAVYKSFATPWKLPTINLTIFCMCSTSKQL